MKSGWQTKTLGDVCSFENGDRGTNYPSRAAQTACGIPFINAGHLTDNGIDIENLNFIPRERFDLLTNGKIRSGDILFCLRGSLGKFASVGTMSEGAIASSLVIVRPRESVSDRFLLAYFQSDLCADMIERFKNGAAQPNLSAQSLANFAIPVPPLPEQHRIVGILDEAFEGIATAKANAEQNLRNARAIFDRHLESVFTQRGDGWVDKRLGDVAESISTGPFGTMLHKSDYVADGIPLVNPMNMVDFAIIPSSRMMVTAKTRDRLSVYVLKVGDVVIARRGELGRCALVTDREAGWLCGTGSFFLRLSRVMDGEFFVALFGSKPFVKRLEANSVGTTMSSLNHGILNELVLPVPPLSEQHSIMTRARTLLAETERLRSVYERKLAALDELKKSLLHQAFAGEL